MNVLCLALALAAGLLLGAIFFGGLWWTVRKGVSSTRPALWFLGSMLLRMGIVLAGFYFVGRRDWQRLVACLLGFIIARFIVMRLTRPPVEQRTPQQRRPAMRLSPDQMIFWQHGFLKLNGTIVFTWALMLVLAVGSKLITRKLSTELEAIPLAEPSGNRRHRHRKQIEDVGLKNPEKYIGFLGTLFCSSRWPALCTIIPGYEPPTGSLSTTAALALCVFVAVPLFGIEEQGVRNYLESYANRPSSCYPFSSSANFRELALAVRLFSAT